MMIIMVANNCAQLWNGLFESYKYDITLIWTFNMQKDVSVRSLKTENFIFAFIHRGLFRQSVNFADSLLMV